MSEDKQYIFNKSEDGKSANILIDGEIGGWWGDVGLKSLAKDIANSDATEIMLQINSGGGSVFEGMAISAFIKGSPTNINTSILGLCASIATPIALAGETTSIAKGSQFMIHNASAFAGGEASDLRGTAELLESIDAQLVSVYVDAIEKNGKLINDSRDETTDKVTEWQNKETWFTAELAVEHGFIGKLTEGVEFVNKANAQDIINSCSKYKNVPTAFLNRVKKIANMADSKEDAKARGLFDKFKALFDGESKDAPIVKEVEPENKEEIERLAAIAVAKKHGFYKEPEKEVVAKDDNQAELIEKLEAEKEARTKLEARLLKLEEENKGAPSGGDRGKDSSITNEEKTFEKLTEPYNEFMEGMFSAIFKS